jgi:hypothetical protein
LKKLTNSLRKEHYMHKNRLPASFASFGASDYALEAADFRDFLVNHISDWEHWCVSVCVCLKE